jgi:hypothetical protein
MIRSATAIEVLLRGNNMKPMRGRVAKITAAMLATAALPGPAFALTAWAQKILLRKAPVVVLGLWR